MKVKSLEFRPHRSLQFLQLLELLEGAANKVAPAQPLWPELFKQYFVNSNTLDSEINVGPMFINFGIFSRPYGLIKRPYVY